MPNPTGAMGENSVDSPQLGLEDQPATLLKSFTSLKAVGESDSGGTKISAVASTAAVDRDGESIDPAGWEWSTPLPKIMYGHNYSTFPIGKITDIGIVKGELGIEGELADQVSPRAAEAAALIKGEFLDQGSVGFDPYAWTEPDGNKVTRSAGEGWPGVQAGRTYTKQSLLEYSVVPVPSNVESVLNSFKSLRTASGRGLFDELFDGLANQGGSGKGSKPPTPPTAEHLCRYCDQTMAEDDNGWVCRKQVCIAVVFGYQEEKETLADKITKALSLLKEVKESVIADKL